MKLLNLKTRSFPTEVKISNKHTNDEYNDVGFLSRPHVSGFVVYQPCHKHAVRRRQRPRGQSSLMRDRHIRNASHCPACGTYGKFAFSIQIFSTSPSRTGRSRVRPMTVCDGGDIKQGVRSQRTCSNVTSFKFNFVRM